MKKAYTKDGRLARVMKICLALPEAIQESAARHATFLVRKSYVRVLPERPSRRRHRLRRAARCCPAITKR